MLGELHSKWLGIRGLDVAVAEHMGIYSGKRELVGQVVPDVNGSLLVMPFMKDGKVVGHKYRGPDKVFWQQKDGRKQFWNVDVLNDPQLWEGKQSLVITEGELDALAVITSGHPWAVSVPDGAPPARDKDGKLIEVPKGTEDINPETDTKYSYLLADWELLSKVKKIIIATDSDESGKRLAEELVRRLDRVRCSFVTYPDGCKDLNEVLQRDGAFAVYELLTASKPYPVDGIYKFSDFPPVEPLVTYSSGWPSLDEIMRLYPSAFMVVGGFPGHGKSTWTMQLAANMAMRHKWNVAVASFEMQIVPYVTNTLLSVFHGAHIKYASPQSLIKATNWLEKHFTFIAPNRTDQDSECDIDWLIDRMQSAVIRDGVRMVLIDPFNEIEHRKRTDESQTEYIGRAIRKLKAFAHQYNILVCVVVHPTKSSAQMDSSELSLYSLADSSHWANKADIGVIIGRVGDPTIDLVTGIYVKKIRYQPDAGKIGEAFLTFDPVNRLFS